MPERPSGVAATRREARERALGLLYEADLKRRGPADVVADLPVEPDRFAVELVVGVGEHLDALDELLGRYARGWEVNRMPAVDRALLRLGAFELVHRPDVPPNVVINEAVDLAKQYSTDDSGRFVNGVLARIAEVEVRGRTP